jgi:hypothetical protein
LIEKRRGWTEDYVLSLPYARFIQIIEQCAIEENEEWKKLTFIGWQIVCATSQSGKVPTFDEYYKSLFKTPDEVKAELEYQDPKKAIERSKNILDMLK